MGTHEQVIERIANGLAEYMMENWGNPKITIEGLSGGRAGLTITSLTEEVVSCIFLLPHPSTFMETQKEDDDNVEGSA